MLTQLLRVVVVLLIGLLPALSQDRSAPTKAELIGQFATLTKANRLDIKVQLSLDDVRKRMASLIDDDKDLGASQKEDLRAVAGDLLSKLRQQTENNLSESQILAKLGEQVVTEVYDKAFTEPELAELIAFFKTPLGQKAADFLATSKSRIENAFKVRVESKIQELSQPMINSSMEELQRRVKEIKNK